MLLAVDVANLVHRYWHARGAPDDPRGIAGAVSQMGIAVIDLADDLSATHLILAADGARTDLRRRALSDDYKAHRPDSPDGLRAAFALFARMSEAMGWLTEHIVGEEADDVLAAHAHHYPGSVVILSADRDLWGCTDATGRVRICLPTGELLDGAGVQARLGVRPDQVAAYKALVGDASDGYVGVEGIGPKTAAKLLAQYDTLDALLAAPDVPGRPGALLRAGEAHARHSHALAQLALDLPLADPPAWQLDGAVVPALLALDLSPLAARISAHAQARLFAL